MIVGLPKWLSIVTAIGFGLRCLFVLVSNHVYYPDEIYQSLEQGLRMVHGYGIVPWDVAYGLRSSWFAAYASLPIWLGSFINLTNPTYYIPATKIWLTFISTAIIPAGYILATLMKLPLRVKFLISISLALWYELIYLSPRALSELIAVYIYCLGIIVFYRFPKLRWIGVALYTHALLLRPQFFPAFTALIIYGYTTRNIRITTFITGSIIGLLPIGLSDLYTHEALLSSIITNINLSLLSGASSVFGTKPSTWYLGALIGANAGLIVLTLNQIKQKRMKYLLYIMAAIILIHSFIPHKEYRFLVIIIPLIIILVNHTVYTWIISKRYKPSQAMVATLLFITTISSLGMLHLLPGQSTAFPYPPLFQDPYLTLYPTIANDSEACGIYHQSRGWVYTGGLYSLGRNIPTYDDSINHNPTNYNYLISAANVPEQYVPVQSTAPYTVKSKGDVVTIPQYTLYKRQGGCTVANNPYRTFEAIELIMRQQGASHVNF